MKNSLSLLLGSSMFAIGTALAAVPANAATINFSINPYTGDSAQVDFTIEDLLGGGVKISASTDPISDIRAIYFNIADDSDLGLTITGDDITQISQSAGAVNSLGNDTGLSGGGPNNPGLFDVGIEFGTQGIGMDDIQSTMFEVEDLTTEDFLGQSFAARLTSVTKGNGRGGSSKLSGTAPEESTPDPEPVPEPAAMAGLMAVGAGIVLNRRKKG